MALPSWFKQSVIRIRPGETTSRGSAIPDWTNTTTETISGCSVQPSSTSLSQDGRVLGISESFTLYAPSTADIQKGDRITYNDVTYTVMGVPRPWMSPTGGLNNLQIPLERWDG